MENTTKQSAVFKIFFVLIDDHVFPLNTVKCNRNVVTVNPAAFHAVWDFREMLGICSCETRFTHWNLKQCWTQQG